MAPGEILRIALRQVLDPGDGLSGFLSRISIVGLVLAVALLLAVMSVMNGFEREMRERILGFVPHITVRGKVADEQWQVLRERLAGAPGVARVEPFYDADALAIQGRDAIALKVLGLQSDVSRFSAVVTPSVLSLSADELLLGAGLARQLGVVVGESVTLLAPSSGHSVLGRPQRFRVRALITTGTELDHSLAIAMRHDVARLVGASGAINGLALTAPDVFIAPRIRWTLSNELPLRFYLSDWTSTHGNLYAAIQLSRNLILLLMASIIAVAAFNVVSSLVLVVTDRAPAIAMLRAIGTRPRDVIMIFVAQGCIIGGLGALLGCGLGLGLAHLAPTAALWLGDLLERPLLNTEVYPVGFLSVSIETTDILAVGGTAMGLCLLAAAIPAWRAARLPVAATLSR